MPKKDEKKKSDGKKDKASNNPDVNDIIHNVIRVLFILKKKIWAIDTEQRYLFLLFQT